MTVGYETRQPTSYDEASRLLSALVAPRPVACIPTQHPSGARSLEVHFADEGLAAIDGRAVA